MWFEEDDFYDEDDFIALSYQCQTWIRNWLRFLSDQSAYDERVKVELPALGMDFLLEIIRHSKTAMRVFRKFHAKIAAAEPFAGNIAEYKLQPNGEIWRGTTAHVVAAYLLSMMECEAYSAVSEFDRKIDGIRACLAVEANIDKGEAERLILRMQRESAAVSPAAAKRYVIGATTAVTVGKVPKPEQIPDGPTDEGGIRLNGINYSLKPQTWRIAKAVWECKGRSLDFLDAVVVHRKKITSGIATRIQRNFNDAVSESLWEMSLAEERFTIRRSE